MVFSRQRRNQLSTFKFLWHIGIPLKWSIVVWKVLHGKLPFDLNLQHKGIHLASKCICCSNPSVESLNHVFVGSDFAQKVWKHFEFKMGIISRASLLCQKINEWWIARIHSPCHKFVLSLIPLGVCWELWCLRNFGRFDGRSMDVKGTIKSLEAKITICLNGWNLLSKRSNWDSSWLFDFVRKAPPIGGKITITTWVHPSSGRFKLNSDGCSKGNLGLARGGCMLRNHQGKFVWALADLFGVATNMVAEVKAILLGVQKCKEVGILNLDIETDSLSLANILCRRVEVPWMVIYDVRKIHRVR